MNSKINIKKLNNDLENNIVPIEFFYGREEYIPLDWTKLDYTESAINRHYIKKIFKLDSNDDFNNLIEQSILSSLK
jgi:hypothetical protein